jgi:hypothetical protein
MDVLQLQTAIEQILNFILNQGPDAIAHLTTLLQMIINGTTSLGAVAILVAKSPALVEITNQLVALISSGAGIPEIAAALAEFATTVGLSVDAVIHLLQMIGSLLLLF